MAQVFVMVNDDDEPVGARLTEADAVALGCDWARQLVVKCSERPQTDADRLVYTVDWMAPDRMHMRFTIDDDRFAMVKFRVFDTADSVTI